MPSALLPSKLPTVHPSSKYFRLSQHSDVEISKPLISPFSNLAMSESINPPPAKRLCSTNDREQVPPDVAEPGILPRDPGGTELSLPVERMGAKALLLLLLETDTGAADLANALKDQQIRNFLQARGLKVHSVDDIGYNSLPLELRDQIRGYVIADVMDDECVDMRRKCSPRLSAYACVDTEWQAAVESITFQSLHMKGSAQRVDQDTEIFLRYVVGSRRQYLQHVCLPCLEPWDFKPCDERNLGIALFSIHRLINNMEQWHEAAMPDRGRRLELDCLDECTWLPSHTRYTELMRSKLSELPSISQFTGISFSGTSQVRVEVVLALLSRLPQLRHISILCVDLNFLQGGYAGDQSDHADRVQLFFTDLVHTLPNLESLEVATNLEYMSWRNVQYRSGLIAYSQKLQRLSLKDISHEAMLECLSPFRADNFDPHSPPPLSWPNLTDFDLYILQQDDSDYIGRMRKLILVFGRALRFMPRIKNLQMELGYVSETYEDRRKANSIFFALEVFWDDALNSSRAKLSVGQRWFDHRDLRMGPLNVAQAVTSEEVRELWRESLLQGANAVLEVDVETEDDSGDDEPDSDEQDSDNMDEDDMDEDYPTEYYPDEHQFLS